VQKGEFGQSITTYEDIIEMDNTALYCYCEAGHSHYKLGNQQDALKFYQKAIRIANLTSKTIQDELVF